MSSKSKTKKIKVGSKSLPYDKYALYKASVQSPDNDVEFIRDVYKELRGRLPVTLREDFCGTHAISCEWVKLNSKFHAVGVDFDTEPLEYGKLNYQTLLKNSERARLETHNLNVLDRSVPHADIVAALNFSYFIFKSRAVMRQYFANCYRSLNDRGLFIVDCFGGTACSEANEEETFYEEDDFSYFWDQESFDPVTNYALFHIHFKRKGEAKKLKAFTYDWRMWSVPEIREIMSESGFKKTHVYWEGTTKNGEGDGDFRRVEKGEECESWISYIVGEK